MTNNKVALVTGGAQGIGFKIAERLVEDGFKVAVVDFNEEGAKAAALKLSSDGTKAIAIKADVSNRDDVFNAVRQTAAHEQFKKFNHGGKIINATSQAGVEGNPGLSLYCSTKFAVRGLTQVAAQDLASEGITVNAFAPGIVQTPMMESIAVATAEEAGKPEAWGWEQFTSQIALGRVSQPEDVSNVVSFLAGKDSDYITGQTIIVDGGMRFR
ncbi:TPA: SDR family oxidoreductase [Staphylococcus aureus]|nr:SDR family oxidoreductase [Staphylococcus aureus]